MRKNRGRAHKGEESLRLKALGVPSTVKVQAVRGRKALNVLGRIASLR